MAQAPVERLLGVTAREHRLKPVQVLFVRRLNDVPDAGSNRAVLEILGPSDCGSSFMRSQRDREHVARPRHVLDDNLPRDVELAKDTLIRMV